MALQADVKQVISADAKAVQDLRDKLVVARSHVQSVLVQLDTETDPRALAHLLARADHLNAAEYRVLPP